MLSLSFIKPRGHRKPDYFTLFYYYFAKISSGRWTTATPLPPPRPAFSAPPQENETAATDIFLF